MKIITISVLLILLAASSYSQKIMWNNIEFERVNTNVEIILVDGVQVLKVERDLVSSPFDEKNIESSVDGPTYVKMSNINMENGAVEVKVLSRIMDKSPFPAARGFIGVAYRVDSLDKKFEAIYLRPSNGRAEDQLRRNHTVQYFSYPGNTFSKLRKDANGVYETYADIGLNEWIDIRIEFINKKATLFINNQQSPSFIVSEMLGSSKSGTIAMWVEVGTVGYFKDLKIIVVRDDSKLV